MGKVYTYGAQAEPFIHLDSDVFLWKRLPDRLESASLLVQNPEYFAAGNSFYRPEKLEQALTRTGQGWLPPEWVWYRTCGDPQRGECCGIFGGNRVDFISHYADLAMKLVGHPLNQQGLSLLYNKMEHNVLFEQYLLSACIEYHRNKADSPYNDIDIQYLFHSMDDAFNPDSATRLGFTRLIGDAKRNRVIADSLEKRVKKDYPAQYERCLQYLQQSSR